MVFGSPIYATEELIAELSAAHLCAEAGISPAVVDYPHHDTPWPESVAGMKKVLEPFSAADQAKVMSENATRLLHL